MKFARSSLIFIAILLVYAAASDRSKSSGNYSAEVYGIPINYPLEGSVYSNNMNG